ncbi:YCF48-related protein [Mucilaginibacter sp.]
MPVKQIKLAILLLLLFSLSTLKAQHITLLQQGKQTSIRGLSVVDDKTAWISGSKGYVAVTLNGGQTWAWQQVKGYETSDFRSIEAFSDKEAIIMSSGTPAAILKTTDGGINWQLKYKNTDSAYFLDAMVFANSKLGYILGDPIKNRFLLLETKDAGESWNNYKNNPVALTGEAAFAASSTCLRVINDNMVIATGGSAAEVDIPNQYGGWIHHQVPVYKGQASEGAFSIAINGQNMVVVGGDYQHDKKIDSTACYSNDGGQIWHLANIMPAGYQSCVEYINYNTLLATGTPGSNLSIDGGLTWTKFDTTSFNVCRKAKHGKLILLAGNGGKIAIYKP